MFAVTFPLISIQIVCKKLELVKGFLRDIIKNYIFQNNVYFLLCETSLILECMLKDPCSAHWARVLMGKIAGKPQEISKAIDCGHI